MATDKKYKACLFDMDGLLINSEDIYTESFSEILAIYGRPQGLGWDCKVKLQGLQGLDAAQVTLDFYGLNDVLTAQKFLDEVSDAQTELWATTKPLPGVEDLLKKLDAEGIPFALCTSSSTWKYHLKTDHLPIFKLFGDNIVTADHPEVKGRGKPEPYVWWTGLAKLNAKRKAAGKTEIKPEESLVFEDAINGVISGKRAGCYCIYIPDEHVAAVVPPATLTELTGAHSEHATLLKSMEEFDADKWLTTEE